MVRSLRHLFRLFRIACVLARHDALFLADRFFPTRLIGLACRPFYLRRVGGRPGQRLAQALIGLGPTFIKLGQALSTRPDLMGEEVAADLAGLRDKLPPFSFAEAQKIVEAELGEPLTKLYAVFEQTPVAAASIAQVHFAETPEGKPVAVKILRPCIEEQIRADVDLLKWLAACVERFQPAMRRLRPVESVATFENALSLEMDLCFEAAACAEMGENFAGDETVRIPAIDWQRTARRVMTQERISGISLDERDAVIAAGLDPLKVVERAGNAFFNMVFRDGFFHADLHPGNLFVHPDGTIVIVDFGITGRLDEKTRRYLGEMLIGFLSGDYRRVSDIHFEAGYVPSDKSPEAFMQALRSIAAPIFGRPIEEISIARLLGQLFHVTKLFEMQAQPQLLLLEKSMLLAEGVGRSLAPDVNMWELSRPLIENWIRTTLGPEARVRRAAGKFARLAERLPSALEHVDQAAAALSQGIRLHPDALKSLNASRRRSGIFPLWLPWILIMVLVALLLLRR